MEGPLIAHTLAFTRGNQLKSAKLLKQRLTTILIDSNYKLISIKKNNEKSHFLLMGPYNTINKLKNDYITLSDSNFEDLDIIIND